MIIKNHLQLFIFLFCFALNLTASAQTAGLIVDPATGSGRMVLDPNLDGYTSATNAGFTTNDQAASEIPYNKLVFAVEPNSDLGSGPNCGYTDFVFSGTSGMDAAALNYLDANNNWLFRLRLGGYSPNTKSYSVLIDIDGLFGKSGPNADPNYVVGNPGFEIELLLGTSNGIYVYDVNNNTLTTTLKRSYTVHTNYQKSIALSTECGNLDCFLDFFVPFGDLTTDFGITTSTPLRFAITDNMSALQSTIGHLSNISDLWGSSGNNETALTDIINNFTPTCASCSPGLLRSACPTVNSPIANGATSVSGTGANGDTIRLYKNGSRIGSTTIVSGGNWTISGLSALSTGNVIGASAASAGKGESIYNCGLITVTSCGTVAPLDITKFTTFDAKGICGNAGAGIDNASIRVYQNGVRVYPKNGSGVQTLALDTITVLTNGSFTWKQTDNTGACGAGSGTMSGSYRVTQVVNGCESDAICVLADNSGSVTSTAAPVITTTPLTNTTTSVSGTCVSGATVIFYINGVATGTVTNPTSTTWNVGSLTLATDQILTAKAMLTSQCLSAASTSVTVARVSYAPVITGTYCGSPVTVVSGTSSEATGTKILIYDNGTLKDSTSVASGGTWTKSGLNIAVGPITAKARITGGSLSSASNSVSISAKTSNAISITTSPITDALTSISGTGTNADTIKLYVDGMRVGSSTLVSGGGWTVSPLVAGQDLILGGIITATATSSGKCQSDPTANVTIACVSPSNLGVTSSVSTCQGSIATGIVINSSQTGVLYQLYDGATPFGIGVLGTGGTINLSSGIITSNKTLTVKALKIGSGSCITNFSQTVSVTMDPADSTWRGMVSTDWFDPRNWCLGGNIPTATTKVKILASGTYMPLIASSGAICDTVIIYSGATLTTSGTQNLDVYGSWINNGTFNANNGTISLKDNNGQYIGGTSTTTFNNLTINNTSNAGINLNQDATVTGALTLIDGIVNTSSSNLLSLTSTASSTGGSSASFIDGPMDKTGTTAFIFPVGDGTVYGPISIGTPTSSSTFKAQYFASSFSNTSTMAGSPSPVLTDVSNNEYWQLDRTSGSGNATVGLYWDNASAKGIDNCSDLRIAKWNGSAWENNNDASTVTSAGCPNPTTEAGNIVTNSDVSSFGTFTFGSKSTSLNPLPVTLISFNAKCKDRSVALTWQTASEINNDYFTIERGLKSANMEPIITVKGSGNSSQLLNYEFIDKDILNTIHSNTVLFYRLKQTDFNGISEYSKFINIENCGNSESSVSLVPNVSDGKIRVINNEGSITKIEIFNSLGSLVYNSSISNSTTELFLNLPQGIYYYILNNKVETVNKGKLIIK